MDRGYLEVDCPNCDKPLLVSVASLLEACSAHVRSLLEEIEAIEPRSDGPFVASTTRKKFHRPDCKWAEYLHPERRREFESRAEALDADMVPCLTCGS